jgi:hypothetical protein
MPAAAPWPIRRLRGGPPGALFTVTVALFTDGFLYGVMVPLSAVTQTGIDEEWLLALMYGGYAIGVLVSTPVLGVLSDRIGRRRPMLWGIAGQAVATALFGGGSVPTLLLARLFQGMASAATWTAGLALVAEQFPEHRAAKLGLEGAPVSCHAWPCDLEGCLTAAPRSGGEPGFRRDGWPLLALRVAASTWTRGSCGIARSGAPTRTGRSRSRTSSRPASGPRPFASRRPRLAAAPRRVKHTPRRAARRRPRAARVSARGRPGAGRPRRAGAARPRAGVTGDGGRALVG